MGKRKWVHFLQSTRNGNFNCKWQMTVASTFQSCVSGLWVWLPFKTSLPWKLVRGPRREATRKFWVFVDGQLKPVFHLLLLWAWQVVEPLSGLLREYRGDHVSWVLGLHFIAKATPVFYAMGSFTGLILKEEPLSSPLPKKYKRTYSIVDGKYFS